MSGSAHSQPASQANTFAPTLVLQERCVQCGQYSGDRNTVACVHVYVPHAGFPFSVYVPRMQARMRVVRLTEALPHCPTAECMAVILLRQQHNPLPTINHRWYISHGRFVGVQTQDNDRGASLGAQTLCCEYSSSTSVAGDGSAAAQPQPHLMLREDIPHTRILLHQR